MESSFDTTVEEAYQEYLKIPKYDRSNRRQENIYDLHWCQLTGRSCISPHPHRHYTPLEFSYFLGKNEEMSNRFLGKEKEKEE